MISSSWSSDQYRDCPAGGRVDGATVVACTLLSRHWLSRVGATSGRTMLAHGVLVVVPARGQ